MRSSLIDPSDERDDGMYLHHPGHRSVTHPPPRQTPPSRRLLVGCLALALAAAACSDSGGSGSADEGSTNAAPASDTATQPTAPDSQRVDLVEPTFSQPTTVDNPLFPISDLHSAILLGNDEGNPLRIETVLLPEPKIVDTGDQEVETLVSQFVSYLDGRIHEVALDWYGQDDAGNVWYFGEDVFNYEDGVVADTEGTWIAGKDGPPGMIMPADPAVGQAYRPENIPGRVFEEVVVKTLDVTVDGPRGPVSGAMVGTENHLLEGNYEDKTFAPGYGEFRSGVGANLEALAVAVPTDAQPAGVPTALETVFQGALEIFAAAGTGDWRGAGDALAAMSAAWDAHRSTGAVPPLLDVQMSEALDALRGNALMPAVDDHNPEGARNAALDAEMAALDLELQYRPPTEIDLGRFNVWANQLTVDSASDEADPGLIAGDVSSLEWVWDRIAHRLDQPDVDEIESQLDALRTVADDEDTDAAAEAAPRFAETVAALQLAT